MRSGRALPASTSNRSPNSNSCPRSRPREWARRRRIASASIPMSMPRPITRSPRARPRTNSAFLGGRAARFMRGPRLPAIASRGVDMHIGSQITELEPFAQAFRADADLDPHAAQRRATISAILDVGRRTRRALSRHQRRAAASGLNMPPMVKRDAGRSRLPAGARARADDHRQCRNPGFARHLCEISGEERDFIIDDAAMNDLIRPTLYDAYHEIWPVSEPEAGAPREPADVVGPVCEIGDYFAKARALPARGGRSAGHHDGRRLWRGAVVDLQSPPAGAGSACQWRAMGNRARPPRL